MGGPEVPPLQECGCLFGRVLLVEFLKGEPYLVGPRSLEMTRWETIECRPLALRQVGWVAQPDIAGAFQHILVLLFAAADLIDRVVDDLDGMELVEGDSGIGQVFGNPLDEGRAHVDTDLFDRFGVAAMRGEVTGERGHGRGVLRSE